MWFNYLEKDLLVGVNINILEYSRNGLVERCDDEISCAKLPIYVKC